MTNTEIKEILNSKKEKDFQKFSSSLIPGCKNMIGVRIPILRDIAKKLAKEDFREYLLNATDDTFEEIMLQGFVIGYCKCNIEERLLFIEKFVPKITDWSINDCFCSTLKFAKKNLNEVWLFLQKYLCSEKEFELRFAVIMLMDYFLVDEYVDRVLELLDSVKNEGYYLKMGVAWAIATSYAKYPEKTHKYLCDNNNLDDFTYNKAIQKMIESYRVSDENKLKLKEMKRNKQLV